MPNRIREVRKSRGLTMKQLGKKIGVTESAISQYETDKRQPDSVTLLKLSNLFDVSVDYLLGAATDKKEQPTVSDELSDAVSMELLNMIRDASEAERRDMLDLLRIVQKRREWK